MLLISDFNTDELAIVVNFLPASMNLNGEACMLLLMTVYHISRNAITDGFL
jgi:hypothetical protein